jgi:hypothetical protein
MVSRKCQFLRCYLSLSLSLSLSRFLLIYVRTYILTYISTDVNNGIRTRADVKSRDPGMAALLTEVYGDGKWRYTQFEISRFLKHMRLQFVSRITISTSERI